MHKTQKAILEIAKQKDLTFIGIRELARMLKVHPQTAKHHLGQLVKKGLIYREDMSSISKVINENMVKIPYMGLANCGIATFLAKADVEGHINVSTALLNTKSYETLFAVKAEGNSLNKAKLKGNHIEDGDYIIIDSKRFPQKGDYVLATVDNLANLKKFKPQYDINGQINRIALISESTDDHDVIFIHPKDDTGRLISGVAIQVIKDLK